MSHDPVRSPERLAFGGLLAFLLAPVIAQGLWRPLEHFVRGGGSAGSVTLGALAVCLPIVLAHVLAPACARLVALVGGGLVILGAYGTLAVGFSGLVALAVTLVTLTFLLPWLFPRLPAALDGLARRYRLLTALYVVLALVSVISTARVSVFIGDPTQVDYQVVPGEKFLETHSCLTAYVRADTLSRQGVDNLYDGVWWAGSEGFPPRPEGVENPYSPFHLDYYAYPPPFLLAMAPLAPFEGDYLAQRALWFGLNTLLAAVGFWIVAQWLRNHRALLLSPLFFASLPVLSTFQVGNFQVAVVVISVLAMVAFHEQRPALGGALLAFAVLSKLSPAVLGVLLLAQRKWRPVAWTVGVGVLYLLLSVLTRGVGPLVSFLTYTVPRLSSGEAFAFFDDDNFSVLINMSPFGIPFKVQLLGIDVGDPWAVGRVVGRVYTVILVVLTALTAFRPSQDTHRQAVSWMALLVLAAIQSPFAPGYTVIALLWAITLLTADVKNLRGAVALIAVWTMSTILPLGRNLASQAVFSLVQLAILLSLSTALVLRGARRAPA